MQAQGTHDQQDMNVDDAARALIGLHMQEEKHESLPEEEDVDQQPSDANPAPKRCWSYARYYVRDIRKTFEDRPHVWKQFLDIVLDAKNATLERRFNAVVTMDIVTKFFNQYGQPRFIENFKVFLPEGSWEHAMSDRAERPSSTTSASIPYPASIPAFYQRADMRQGTQEQRTDQLARGTERMHLQLEQQQQRAQEQHTSEKARGVERMLLYLGLQRREQANAAEVPQQPPAGPCDNFQPLSLDEALIYVDDVKTTYINRPHVYRQFLDTLKDFRCGALNSRDVVARIAQLFNDSPRLIDGFNKFLPPTYKISM